MGMARRPIEPNAENCSLAELEVAMDCTPKKQNFIRMQAIRSILFGVEQAIVAKLSLVSLRTLADWIRQFNQSGIDGLIDKPRSGRPCQIPCHLEPELKALITQPEHVNVTHWTGKKFHGYLTDTLNLQVGYSTVIRWLQDNNFRIKVPRHRRFGA